MKGKVLIVLASLALVFGMLIASCDNDLLPKDPYKDDPNKTAFDAATFTLSGTTYSYQTLYAKGVQKTADDVDTDGNPVLLKGGDLAQQVYNKKFVPATAVLGVEYNESGVAASGVKYFKGY